MVSGGCSAVAVHRLLIAVASLVVGHGWASAAVGHGLSCSEAWHVDFRLKVSGSSPSLLFLSPKCDFNRFPICVPSDKRHYTQERSFLVFYDKNCWNEETWLLTGNAFRETTWSKGETVKKIKKYQKPQLNTVGWPCLLSPILHTTVVRFLGDGMMCFFYCREEIQLHWKNC